MHSLNFAGKPGLVLTNALVLSDLAYFWVVGDPEAIRFDVVEVARSRLVWHRICDGRFAVLKRVLRNTSGCPSDLLIR